MAGFLMAIGDRVESRTLLRKLFSGLVLLLAAAAFIVYAQEEDMILELKDVQFFKAQQINSLPVTIRLSGLAFHSSLAIQDITTAQHDESLQVLVRLTLAREGLSGNLNYTLAIPASVNTVTFGMGKAVIWNRSTGIVQPR
jgi:hypothetical protein